MLRKTHIRRPVAALLMLAGGAMMYLAQETWTGALLLALGAAVEAAGIALRHKD